MKITQHIALFLAMLLAALMRCFAIGVYYFCGGWKRAVANFQKIPAERMNAAE